MNAALYLIPISLALGVLALVACLWTILSRQYDNLDTERYRILEEDQAPLDSKQAKRRRTLARH